MASTSTAAGGVASGGLKPPHPNPSGDGGPTLRSPPGKANKPVALADITNTGRPNATRAISVPDLVMENAKLMALLKEKTKIIDLSRIEMHKLRLALQSSRQQNLQFAQVNSQMLAEINTGRDQIRTLQHELSCTQALLKVKGSEFDGKKKAANVQRKRVKSQVLKATASIVTTVEAPHFDNSASNGVEHHLVESQSALPSNTICQEPPQDAKQNRMPQRRRSLRLNQGSFETSGVSQNTLHEDTVVPLAPSTSRVQKQYGQTTGKDMGKSLQNESIATVVASEFEETEINKQPQTTLKEIQEACSREAGAQSHKIGDKACNSKQNHLQESQSSLTNIIEAPKPPEDNGIKRGSRKRSAIEDVNAKIDTTTSESSCHDEKRKSQRRKSEKLSSVSSKNTNIPVETVHEDVIASLSSSSSNASREQRTNQEQNNDCSSRKSNEWQIPGRRSLRRAAEKVVSYKEIPLNVKMRRP